MEPTVLAAAYCGAYVRVALTLPLILERYIHDERGFVRLLFDASFYVAHLISKGSGPLFVIFKDEVRQFVGCDEDDVSSILWQIYLFTHAVHVLVGTEGAGIMACLITLFLEIEGIGCFSLASTSN